MGHKSSINPKNVVEVVDLKTEKKLVLSFERKLKDNIEARLKHPNQLDQFADSEIDLHNDLHKLSIPTRAPELYLDLVNLNAIPSILNLLAHGNTNIAVDVVQLLQDLTDPNVFEDDEESDEPTRVLVDVLVENNVLELLVQNLQRLNDSNP